MKLKRERRENDRHERETIKKKSQVGPVDVVSK